MRNFNKGSKDEFLCRCGYCENCGQEITGTSYQTKKRRFCSIGCWNKVATGKQHPYYKGPKNKVCKNCGKNYLAKYQCNATQFCSQKCFKKYRSKISRTTFQCEVCNTTFEVLNRDVRCRAKKGKKIQYCSKACHRIAANKNMNQKSTSIELKVEDYLIQLGIKYESQKVIPEGRTISDFYIPEQRLVIYADGHYWHSLPGAKNKDCRQDFLLGMNGYKVLRLSENKINDDSFKSKLKKEITL